METETTTKPEIQPAYLTIAAACKFVGLGRTTIETLVRQHKLRIRRYGRKPLIEAASLREWIEALPTD